MPLDLMHQLQQVETDLGREPSVQYGPRLIDIDILLYSNLVYRSTEMIIPHPHISERIFVLAPLAELVPDLLIPGFDLSVKELVDAHAVNGYKIVQ
jgi:2-amino-4-hydroxy-6-hydroxymethyldihydropteridine diphosphokinase